MRDRPSSNRRKPPGRSSKSTKYCATGCFPNLYGDNSAFNLPLRGWPTRLTTQEPLASRMIYGSDFPVPIMRLWSWLRGFIDWKTYRHWERHPNALERDYQLKRAVGFPEASFTRLHSLLRRI